MMKNEKSMTAFFAEVAKVQKINIDQIVLPPSFLLMKGEFTSFDVAEQSLQIRFPVLESYLNPYQTMQGGMIAAAIDNVIGPLSMAVAEANMTRNLEVKYHRPITMQDNYIYVRANYLGCEKKFLVFEAVAENEQGLKLASAKAKHWQITRKI